MENIICHPAVVASTLFTNDVIEMYHTLGIEAARYALLKEIKQVIEFDGSYVNYRHLSVLVDTMTYKGSMMAITRHGINRTDTGVLMRCSFEETVNIITDAAMFAERDRLRGVTENIIMGKQAHIGTGCVDILMDFSRFQELSDMQNKGYRPSSPINSL